MKKTIWVGTEDVKIEKNHEKVKNLKEVIALRRIRKISSDRLSATDTERLIYLVTVSGRFFIYRPEQIYVVSQIRRLHWIEVLLDNLLVTEVQLQVDYLAQ